MIKVGLIEDDDLVRNELVQILKTSTELEPVSWSESAENFLNYCPSEIDYILLDIGLPGISGIEAIPKLKTKIPNVAIVILSSFKDNEHIFNAFKAGAVGYVLKDSELSSIEKTLYDLHNGIPALSPSIARRMIDYFSQNKVEVKNFQLTNKEKEVLRFLVNGLSYKLIADKLGISINGVRFHIKNIYSKLHIHSRPELLKMYMNGEIKLDFDIS